jgi:hypothetical protein
VKKTRQNKNLEPGSDSIRNRAPGRNVSRAPPTKPVILGSFASADGKDRHRFPTTKAARRRPCRLKPDDAVSRDRR